MSSKLFLSGQDLQDENVFEEVWLPVGDDKSIDIEKLIAQDRIRG